jgi:hypothetical protein
MAEKQQPKKSLKDRARGALQSLIDAMGALLPEPQLEPIPVRSRYRR